MLGLDENEIVSLYEHSTQQLGEPSLVPKSRLEMAPVRSKPRWPWVVGGAAIFFLASALVAYLSEHGLPWIDATPDESTAPVLQEAPPTTAQALPAAASIPPIAGPAGTAPDATAATASGALQSGQVSLQLKFAADSWVEVFDGSGKAVLYDLAGLRCAARLVAARGCGEELLLAVAVDIADLDLVDERVRHLVQLGHLELPA